MPLPIRRFIAQFLTVLAIAWVTPVPARGQSAEDRDEVRRLEAESLHAHALRMLAQRTLEGRRRAIADLERATVLAPERADFQLLLARTYQGAGFLKLARQRFERVARLDPDDPEARFGLAQMWRRDWLKYLDGRSLDRALEHVREAVRIEPGFVDAWITRSSLLVEKGDLVGALAAAEAAHRIEPDRPEALVALGSARWRLGRAEEADSAFHAALPRMRRALRERFEDIAPLVLPADTMAYNRLEAEGRREWSRRFWAEHDPDLATGFNEARLEYWSRVAQAWFLFFDPRRREWDERGEVYIRYGPPEKADYNPVGQNLHVSIGGASRTLYPANMLVWSYPSLGLHVALQDRLLSEYYQLPLTLDRDRDPRPDPDSLAKRDVVGTPMLRGVFPTRPPGVPPLEFAGSVAVLGHARGGELLAALELPARLDTAAVGEWVVLDSLRREVARGRRAFSASACDPTLFQVADFAVGLPPGEYRVGLTASRGRARGSMRFTSRVSVPDSMLLMSDLIITCGTPAAPAATARLDPNPAARVASGRELTAYFEVRELARGADGMARFQHEYSVQRRDRDRRVWLQRLIQPRPAPASLFASRSDEQTSDLRRQYLRIPVRDLSVGPYRLRVRVVDLVSGEERTREADFTVVPATGAEDDGGGGR